MKGEFFIFYIAYLYDLNFSEGLMRSLDEIDWRLLKANCGLIA
jgi:hypothetical protein